VRDDCIEPLGLTIIEAAEDRARGARWTLFQDLLGAAGALALAGDYAARCALIRSASSGVKCWRAIFRS
jgi:hypothetical protein